MKKIITIILILLPLICLSSCSEEKNESLVTPQNAELTAPPTVTITFPEGYTTAETAELLQSEGVCNAKEFISLSNDISFLKTQSYSFLLGIKEPESRPFVLEGYIFPDTYEFYIGEGAQAALTRFLENTEKRLSIDYYIQAETIGYSIDEILTLASIIQEEASHPEDMPLVSSVLHNRLESPDYGMLQCDVTVNYVNDTVAVSPYINANIGKVTELYDTYEMAGLPVGPISNPGAHAIEAALNPPKSNYFFFVTDDSMNYYYAETYEEHQINCENVGING